MTQPDIMVSHAISDLQLPMFDNSTNWNQESLWRIPKIHFKATVSIPLQKKTEKRMEETWANDLRSTSM